MKKIKNHKIINVAIISVIFLTFFTLFSSIMATDNTDGIFDSKFTQGIYKSSEDTNSKLPFFRFSTDRVIFDSNITNPGVTFSGKSIEVNDVMKNMQIMFSSDSVRLNSDFERGLVIADGNINIESNVAQNIVVISTGVVTIGKEASIAGNLFVIGNEIKIDGVISGNVLGSVSSCNVTGKIEGDLRVYTENLSIESNENINGNIYVETYNKDINLNEMYPNAKIKLKEIKHESAFSSNSILNIITVSLILTLLYVIVSKVSKGKLYENVTNKLKNNSVFAVISSAVLLLSSIPVVFLLIVLSIIGLWVVTIPILLVYIVFLVIAGILDVFVVGSLMYKYVKEKYLKSSGVATDIIGAFVVFFVLYLLTKVPFIGGYISIVLLMASIGILFTYIFKKVK